MKLSLIALSSLSLFGMISCSNDHNASSLNNVANPGDPGAANVLYWVDQADVYRATCLADKPVVRANCTTDMVKTATADVSKRATDLGNTKVATATASVNAEVKALKDADPTVQSLVQQVTTLSNQKVALESGIAADTKQIDSDTKAKASLDAQIADFDLQLAAIAKRLQANPSDPDKAELLKLQDKLQYDRKVYSDNSAAYGAHIASTQQHLAWQQTTLAAVTTNLKARQDELKKTYDELMVTSPNLTQLLAAKADSEAALAGIPTVLSYISQADVTYRSNLWTKAQQGSLSLIDSSFGPSNQIKPGRYVVESGYSRFCAHRVEPTVSGNTLTIYLTYLSPCGGVREGYVCNKNVCTHNSARVMTIQDGTHYHFRGDGNTAVFKFSSDNMELDVTKNGPELNM